MQSRSRALSQETGDRSQIAPPIIKVEPPSQFDSTWSPSSSATVDEEDALVTEHLLTENANRWVCQKSCRCRIRALLIQLEILQLEETIDHSILKVKMQQRFLASAFKEQLRGLRDTKALLFLNLLDKVSSNESNDSIFKIACQSWTRKLARYSNRLPSSLFVEGVAIRGSFPYFGGGAADIYKADYEGMIVAVKAPRLFRNRDDPDREIWHREALIWQQFSHPRILRFIGVATDAIERRICLVSPWMENGDMNQYLNKVPSADPLLLMKQVAEGLAYLHSREFNHGDIKPGNVLINDEGEACLGDLGLSKVKESTMLHNTGGSQRYLAPELIRADSPQTTNATDIYAFSMTFYEAVTGQIPFHNCKVEAKVNDLVQSGERPERPLQIRSERLLSSNVWKLIQACWKHDPFGREPMAIVLKRFETLHEVEVSRSSTLSPYSYHVVDYHGLYYTTTYHLWEALKYIEDNPALAKRIQESRKVSDLKTIVRDAKARREAVDWEESKMMNMMIKVLELKFRQHPEAKKELLDTGDDEIYYISKDDAFWGCSEGKHTGLNYLGQCLRRLRAIIRRNESRG